MTNCWHENYIDMTDRQYLTILPADGEEKEQPEGKRLNLRKNQ